jgi:serine O-acetyltransferase
MSEADYVIYVPEKGLAMSQLHAVSTGNMLESLWPLLRREASDIHGQEPSLASLLHAAIIGRNSFADALAHVLADELASKNMDAVQLLDILTQAYQHAPAIVIAAQHDLMAVTKRDPAATSTLIPFLFFKGFHALQSYRIAHWLWQQGRPMVALYLQSRIAKRFAVDIHPAAQIGQGIMMDHANGIVIGETSVVEDNVSFLHSVTLGGTGKDSGDRHPKIRKGVMIGAGAKILGNIEVGSGSRVAAGSVVLENVPPCVTVAGVPAKIIGKAGCDEPAEKMDQLFPCSDFTI